MSISDVSAASLRARNHWVRATSAGVMVCVLTQFLVACAWLPSSGPTTAEVTSQAVKDGRYQFDLIEVDQKVMEAIAARPIAASLHSRFGGERLPPEQTISVGDVIGLAIYQSIDANIAGVGQPSGSPAGSPALGNGPPATVVPDQLVMRDGTIMVPYVGRVRLVGISPRKAEAKLQDRLKDQLIKPQVILSINKSDANTVILSGEGTNNSRVQLSPRGTRLLDIIAGTGAGAAAAGNVGHPTYGLLVRLTRGGVSATIPYDKLVTDPAENIYVHPGDIVTVTVTPSTFGTFGAAGRPLQYAFGADNITLGQALAMTAGLDDSRADPAGVFLMRHESRSFVRQMLGQPGGSTDISEIVPVIYHFDLSDPIGYLFTQRFAMNDKDMIYVANAKTNAFQKFVSLLGGMASTALTISTLSDSGASAAIAVTAPLAVAPAAK